MAHQRMVKNPRLRFIVPLVGLVSVLLVAALYVRHPRTLSLIDLRIYDHLLRTNAANTPHPALAIVDIDEDSLRRLGQWPWPRHRIARLVDRLNQAGAVVVGLDILFAEPDRTSPQRILSDLETSFGPYLEETPSIQGVPDILRDNDQLLAQTLATGPYVLGYAFRFDAPAQATQTVSSVPSVGLVTRSLTPQLVMAPEKLLPTAREITPPLAILARAAPASGYFTTRTDPDGTVRRVPLLVRFNGKAYPSLALATLLQASDTQTVILNYSERGTESLAVAGTNIPLGTSANFLVNYRGPENTYPYVSAEAILRGSPEAFQAVNNKIVFVGTSAAGLKDIRTTPFSQNFPGVETHATIVDNILSQDFIRIPPWAPGLEMLALLGCGLLTVVLLAKARAAWLLPPLLGLGVGIWYGADHLFAEYHYFVSPFYPLLCLVLTFTAMTTVKFWREERQKQFIEGAFSHYLAPAVIQRIVKNPNTLTLDGEEREVTILFSDIRNFTSLSEQLPPSQVSELLREYLTPMTRIITERDGTLDKFIGDAVMAFWNAPLNVPLHPQKALDAALTQLQILEKLNQQFKQNFGLRLEIGIGLHSGIVRVGNMGSADLFDYTLIGDNVNLASRLEGLTKYYGLPLLVSEEVAKACENYAAFWEIDRVRVKGRENPLTIYAPISQEDRVKRETELNRYAQAKQYYCNGRFAEAQEAFALLQRDYPDSRLYKILRKRCAELETACPENWDGVYTHATK